MNRPDATAARLVGEGLTFDDVLLVPRRSAVLPGQTPTCAPALPAASSWPSRSLRGHGHRHREPDGDHHGARRRNRHHPQEHVHRPAGRGGGPGKAVGERDDRQAVHHRPARDAGRRAAADGALAVSGIPVVDEGRLVGIITNRDLQFETDRSRPVHEVMTPRRPAGDGARGHLAGRGARDPAPAPHREAAHRGRGRARCRG